MSEKAMIDEWDDEDFGESAMIQPTVNQTEFPAETEHLEQELPDQDEIVRGTILDLIEAIDNVTETKDKLATAKEGLTEMIKNLTEQFEAENKDLIDQLADEISVVENTKNAVRKLAIDNYKKTQSKQLGYGVSIRINKDYIYPESEAMTWAIEHKLCLALDKKAFEATAKASVPVDGKLLGFVTVEEKETVVFASSADMLKKLQ